VGTGIIPCDIQGCYKDTKSSHEVVWDD